MDKPQFFTTGYTGKDVNDLKPLLDTLDAILVDVRFSPVSKHYQWSKENLSNLLKTQYRHVVQLGNRTYLENRITIQHLSLGIQTLESFKKNAVLLCGCADYKSCHRLVLAHELRRKGYSIEEIGSWKVIETSLF